MITLRSDKHVVYTEEINDVALSADDDKRIIMEDGISTLAYGHYNAHLYLQGIYIRILYSSSFPLLTRKFLNLLPSTVVLTNLPVIICPMRQQH